MSEPTTEKCPKCGAGNKRWDFRTGSGYNYACGTLFEESTKKCVESRFCITAQRDQLATRITNLQQQLLERAHVIANDTERIQQLEHVCRLMAKTLRNYPEHAWIVEEFEKVVGE